MSFETTDLNTVAPMSPYVFCISCCHCVYTECTIVHSNSLFQLFSKHELRVFRLPARRDDACVRAPWAWDGVACMRSRVWCVTYGFPCMGSRVWCVAYAVRASDTHTRGHIGIFLWQGHVAGMWQVAATCHVPGMWQVVLLLSLGLLSYRHTVHRHRRKQSRVPHNHIYQDTDTDIEAIRHTTGGRAHF